jgi:hypothetical protein
MPPVKMSKIAVLGIYICEHPTIRARSLISADMASPTTFAYVGSYTGFTEKGQLGWVGSSNAGTGITTFLLDEVSP